jgi:hypothetical protein
MVVLYFASVDNSEQLWKESSYLLSLTTIFEFRVGIAEILRFGSNSNSTLSAELSGQQAQLNALMVEYAKSINENTSNSDVSSGVFSFHMPIADPFENLTYSSSLPQAVSQLAYYFLLQDDRSHELLRFNYENLHQNLTSFYEQRYEFYHSQKLQFKNSMLALLAVYSAIMFLIALSSIPIFLYFKNEEESVRSKLAFMSLREIRKAITRLKLLY